MVTLSRAWYNGRWPLSQSNDPAIALYNDPVFNMESMHKKCTSHLVIRVNTQG